MQGDAAASRRCYLLIAELDLLVHSVLDGIELLAKG